MHVIQRFDKSTYDIYQCFRYILTDMENNYDVADVADRVYYSCASFVVLQTDIQMQCKICAGM